VLGEIIEWRDLNKKIPYETAWDLGIANLIQKLQFSEKYHLNSDNEIFKIWLKQPW